MSYFTNIKQGRNSVKKYPSVLFFSESWGLHFAKTITGDSLNN